MSLSSLQSDRAMRAQLLGPITIRVGNRLLIPGRWPRRQARTILLMLLGTPGHWVSRDFLVEAIWPDQDPAAQLNAFYKAVHTLRRALEPDLARGRSSAYIDVSNEGISLRPQHCLPVDVDLFEKHLQEAERASDPREHLKAALNIYRGPFLANELYADWPAPRREALESMRLHATLRLAELDRANGQPLASIGHLEALLVDQPALEPAHQAIIKALLASGQQTLALQQIERCRRAVERELGHALSSETKALETAARNRAATVRLIREPGAPAPHQRLPGVPTPTIGRRGEIAMIRDLLIDPDGPRLVTIAGTGGVGKTRLAIESARVAAAHLTDGVTFVDLTAIRDVALLPTSLANALGVQPRDDQPLRNRVREMLERVPRHLLVLDNLEHLPGIEREIAALLTDLPRIRILATSREPARIRAEWLVRLEPFDTPDAGPEIDAGRLRGNDAVALFLQCAAAWGERRESNRFSLTDIAALVRELDGLPLAIELAAARSSEMTPGEMLAQIENRFGLLREGPRDLPDRHQTLAATIDWSYQLLPPEEQRLFRELSVFANGVETDTLQSLFGDDAIARVSWLAEKSLVRWARRDGVRRVEILESIRSYAEQRLVEQNEFTAARQMHARYFADLVTEADARPAKRGAVQIGWMQRLAREHDNLQLALANSLETGDATTALALTSGMGFYCLMHHSPEDIRSWIVGALAFDPEIVTETAGWTAIWGAEFSWRAHDTAAAQAFIERARSIWKALQHNNGLTWADGAMAGKLARSGRYEEAVSIHRANTPLFRSVKDFEGVASSLTGIAWSLQQLGRSDEAIEALEEALAAAREAENFVLQSYVLPRLGMALADIGKFERAGHLAVEGERIARWIDDRQGLPWLLAVQARAALHAGDVESARLKSDAALAAFQAVGDRPNAWWGSLTCLSVRIAAGDLEAAAAFGLDAIDAVRHADEPRAMARLLPALGQLVLALGNPALALTALTAAETTTERPGETTLPRYESIPAEAIASLSESELRAARQAGTLAGSDSVVEQIRTFLAGNATVSPP